MGIPEDPVTKSLLATLEAKSAQEGNIFEIGFINARNAPTLLQAVDTLLRIPLDSTQQLHIGNLLNQIASHNVDNSLSLLFSGTLEHTWAVSTAVQP